STGSYPASASCSERASSPGEAERSSTIGSGLASGGGKGSASAAADAQTSPPAARTSSARARSPTRCGGGSRPEPHWTPRLGSSATRSSPSSQRADSAASRASVSSGRRTTRARARRSCRAASNSGSAHDAAAPAANRHLVYVAGQDPSQAGVWLADVDGSNARRLGPGSVAVLTPDGKTVAVRRPGGIYLVSTGGKVLRRLTSRRLRPQAWSPDGRTLIATRAGDLAVLELDAIDRKTGRVRLLSSGSIYGFDFSPKGDELVYSRAPSVTGQGLC